MSTVEIIIAVVIHLIIPIAGIILYLRLLRKASYVISVSSVALEFGLIFMTYGGLLLVVLTSMFWYWSGMASLGVFYLILAAPIIMGVIAYRNNKKRILSKYHRSLFRAAILYYPVATASFLGVYYIHML